MNRLRLGAATAAIIAPITFGVANVSATSSDLEINSITLGASSVTVARGEQKQIDINFNPTSFDPSDPRVAIDCAPEDIYSSTASCYYSPDTGKLNIYGSSAAAAAVDYTVTVGVYAEDDEYHSEDPPSSASADLSITVSNALKSSGDWSNFDDGYGVMVEFATAVDGADHISAELIETPATATATEEDLIAVFDVTVLDGNGNPISISGNETEITFQLDQDTFGEYEHFQMVYINADGEIVEWFDPTRVVSEYGYYYVTFSIPHLSPYGVLASDEEFESAEDKNAAYAAAHPTDDETDGETNDNTDADDSESTDTTTVKVANTGALSDHADTADSAKSSLLATIAAAFATASIFGITLRVKKSLKA